MATVPLTQEQKDRELIELPELETPCKVCSGAGGWDDDDRGWHRCEICEGAGCIPTVTGAKILRLLRHNFKALLEDAS